MAAHVDQGFSTNEKIEAEILANRKISAASMSFSILSKHLEQDYYTKYSLYSLAQHSPVVASHPSTMNFKAQPPTYLSNSNKTIV